MYYNDIENFNLRNAIKIYGLRIILKDLYSHSAIEI